MASMDHTIRMKAPAARLTVKFPAGFRLRLALLAAVMRLAAWVSPMRTQVEWEVLGNEPSRSEAKLARHPGSTRWNNNCVPSTAPQAHGVSPPPAPADD